jgi:hypothetical protein
MKAEPFRGVKAGLLCVAVAVVIALYLWSPILRSWWYITDDYRWPTILGPGKSISFSQFLANCNPPDWHLGSKVNRPTYYCTTSAMMYLFGDRIILWNLARIAIMASSLAMAGWVVSRLVGLLAALPVVVLMGIHPLWYDALPRLQSELFAFLGLSAVGWLAWRAHQAQREASPGWRRHVLGAGLLVAALYAAGAKEIITALMALVAVLALLVTRKDCAGPTTYVKMPAILALGYCGFLSYCVYLGLRGDRVDLYGRKLSLGALARLFASGLLGQPIAVLLLALALALYLFLRLRSCVEPERARRLARWNLLMQLALVVFSAFTVVFYRGDIPAGARYQFPYAFLPSLGVVIFTAYGYGLVETEFPRRKVHVSILAAVVPWCLALLIASRFDGGLASNRRGAIFYTAATERFRDRLALLTQAAKEDPGRPIVFQTYGFNDTEPLLSVDLFLKFNGCANPIYLSIVGYSEGTAKNPLERNLARLTEGYLTSKRFLPSTDDVARRGIRVNFSKAKLDDGELANFWPP